MRTNTGRKRQNIVGNNVRIARTNAKMSQEELANKLETVAVYVCRGSISRLENGDRAVNDIEVLGLSQVLNIPIQELFVTQGESSKET